MNDWENFSAYTDDELADELERLGSPRHGCDCDDCALVAEACERLRRMTSEQPTNERVSHAD